MNRAINHKKLLTSYLLYNNLHKWVEENTQLLKDISYNSLFEMVSCFNNLRSRKEFEELLTVLRSVNKS